MCGIHTDQRTHERVEDDERHSSLFYPVRTHDILYPIIMNLILLPPAFHHLNTYLWWDCTRVSTRVCSSYHFESPFCGRFFLRRDSDRFITSFLIQKCDSFASLYVFLITSAPLVCCIMLVYVFDSRSKKSEKVNSFIGPKDLNFNILLHKKTVHSSRLWCELESKHLLLQVIDFLRCRSWSSCVGPTEHNDVECRLISLYLHLFWMRTDCSSSIHIAT